jgi:hypothetical protein
LLFEYTASVEENDSNIVHIAEGDYDVIRFKRDTFNALASSIVNLIGWFPVARGDASCALRGGGSASSMSPAEGSAIGIAGEKINQPATGDVLWRELKGANIQSVTPHDYKHDAVRRVVWPKIETAVGTVGYPAPASPCCSSCVIFRRAIRGRRRQVGEPKGEFVERGRLLAYITGTGAARLVAILAGESPANRGGQSLLWSYPAAGRATDRRM